MFDGEILSIGSRIYLNVQGEMVKWYNKYMMKLCNDYMV